MKPYITFLCIKACNGSDRMHEEQFVELNCEYFAIFYFSCHSNFYNREKTYTYFDRLDLDLW